MGRKGLFIDYEFCTGCKTCVVACKMEKDLPQEQYGIVVSEVGPWEITPGDHRWQYSYVPIPTDQCDLCAERREAGKTPICVQSCQADVMKYGDIAELQAGMEAKTKVMLYTLE